MAKPVKNRRVKRMKISQSNTGGYSLIPHKRPTDPYSLPVTKGDLHELKDALIWPPEITRNVYGQKMQDLLKQHRDLLTGSSRMTPQELIYKSIDLSGQFYTANKKYFELESSKAGSEQAPANQVLRRPPDPPTPAAPKPESPVIKASPYAIKRAVQGSKKKKFDIRRKLIRDLRDEDIMGKLRKSYEEKKKSTQSFYKQLRLAGKKKYE